MNTTIYLTRHGQTEWNLEKRLQGRGDSPLTVDGIQKAQELAMRVNTLGVEYIYTSPIERARRTAHIIRGNSDIPVIEEDALVEMAFGDYEGDMIEEVIERNPDWNLYEIMKGNKEMRAPNGETLLEVCERINKVMDTLIQQNEGKTILIVTHGMTLKAIMQYFKDEESVGTVMGQATLTKIEVTHQENKAHNIHRIIFKDDCAHFTNLQDKIGW